MIRAAVLGADVSKSRSPAIHRAAYRALGIEGTFEAISVPTDAFVSRVLDLASQGYAYVNVTIPHKAQAASLATTRSAFVRRCGAANTLVFEPGPPPPAIHAENTDGHGLLAALRDLGVEPEGADIVLVGAGGAAAGALEALTAAGARVRLAARRPDAARELAARVASLRGGRRAPVETFGWADGDLSRAVEGARVLVSSVPASVWEDSATAQSLAALPRDAAVLEMAYGAAGASPLARVVAGGAWVGRYADGLAMLVHQAARAIELALGEAPPLTPLFEAARAAH